MGETRRFRLVLIVALYVGLLGCGSAGSDVVVDRSTPQSTVLSYLQALADGDGELAGTLMTPEARTFESIAHWIGDPPDISDPAIVPGGGEYEGPPYWQGSYTQAFAVHVTFYLDDFSAQDGFLGGETYWGFTAVRNLPDEGWLIAAGGV